MFTIRKVYIEKLTDLTPCLDHLEQFDPADAAPEVQRYAREDRERLEAYNRGEWWCIGLRATVELLHSSGPGATVGTVHRLSTGGLWGIESDSGEAYFREVAAEEVADLRGLCLDLAGVTPEALEEALSAIEWREGGRYRRGSSL